MKPEYAKAAEDLIRNDPPIALVKVDCTEAGKETCNKHGVSGYPTLKIFRNGDVSQEYNGPREAAGNETEQQRRSVRLIIFCGR